MSQYIDFGFSVLQTSVYGSRFYVRDDSRVTPTRKEVGELIFFFFFLNKRSKCKKINAFCCLVCKKKKEKKSDWGGGGRQKGRGETG